MIIKYRILHVFPENHSATVRFYSDHVSEEDLASDLANGRENILRREDGSPLYCRTDCAVEFPIPMIPDGPELDEHILKFAPAMFIKRMKDIANTSIDTSNSHVPVGVEKTMIYIFPDVRAIPEMKDQINERLTDEEIMDLIKKTATGS
jgi:hypothetical protein